MLEEIYSRRSIRKYASEPISRSIIEKIIDAGRVAPSAKNRQPWKYLVYSGEAKARLLSIMKKGIEMEEIMEFRMLKIPSRLWKLHRS